MRTSIRRYCRLARFWGHCFVGTTIAFAVFPHQVGHFLTWEGGELGLGGQVTVGRGTLAWALALSLMATLTLLAYRSASHPRDRLAYRALMCSKLASTAVFLYLAAGGAPVWLLAAATDGFIAATLFVGRLPVPDAQPVEGFLDRYLTWMGVGPDGKAHVADTVARSPWPVQGGIRLANSFFTYAAPPLLAGWARTATRLDDERVQKLVERIRNSRRSFVRVLWVLLHQPTSRALAEARRDRSALPGHPASSA